MHTVFNVVCLASVAVSGWTALNFWVILDLHRISRFSSTDAGVIPQEKEPRIPPCAEMTLSIGWPIHGNVSYKTRSTTPLIMKMMFLRICDMQFGEFQLRNTTFIVYVQLKQTIISRTDTTVVHA